MANARALAEAVTADRGSSALWREFRAVEFALRNLMPMPDEFSRIVESLRADAVDMEKQKREREQ